MNIFRMLSAVLRGLNPHPVDKHIRALQSKFSREAALQWGRDIDWDGCTVSKQQLNETIIIWERKS